MKLYSKRAFSLVELSIVILIIGIIIAGVTQSSGLLDKSRLINAQTLTQSSPVSGIENLVLWLEPTLSESFGSKSLPEDSSAVAKWYDTNPQSSIKNNAAQTNSGQQPKFITKCINDLPCIRFNKDNKNDLVSPLKINITPNLTIFIVFNRTARGMYDFLLGNEAIQIGFINTTQLNVNNNSLVDTYYSNFLIPLNTPKALTLILRSNVTDGSSAFVNGSSGEEFTFGFNTNGGTELVIGDGGVFNICCGREFFGDISEVIIFDRALKNEERKAVEDYLGKKWQIKIDN